MRFTKLPTVPEKKHFRAARVGKTIPFSLKSQTGEKRTHGHLSLNYLILSVVSNYCSNYCLSLACETFFIKRHWRGN
jgi:hypothetical protein